MATAPVAPVKRGPGRPPGSNNKNTEKKPGPAADEPPTKKAKPDKAPAEAVAPLTKPAPAAAKVNIARWSVAEVCEFIKQLPGCSDYVEDFMVQEIDGQALMLLQADHLMSAMSIKLGPALKICEQVQPSSILPPPPHISLLLHLLSTSPPPLALLTPIFQVNQLKSDFAKN